jgi:D-hexose-6-phosphate mutarotase
MAMVVKRRGYIEAGRVVVLHPGYPRLENMADFPELGALVHVLIEPLLTHRQMELLDEKGELGVEGSEKRKHPLKELD